MSFSELLSQYIQAYSISAAELSHAAGIAPSTISRYLKSKQSPGETALHKIASALSSLAPSDTDDVSEETIYHVLCEAASGIETDYESCMKSLKKLLTVLEVKNNELARALSYDPSYISRILSGNRRPANLTQFLTGISGYLGSKYYDSPKQAALMELIGSHQEIKNPGELAASIRTFLGQTAAPEEPQISHFLETLDSFDLNEFMQSIHFKEMKVPTAPFQLPTTKVYTGIPEMMQAELDFLKSAVLSRSMEDVILYSDMPMEEMSKDSEFPKKWMFGMAMLLRKGLHLQNIHDVHRPLSEMFLGLEGWIPMYMTGQVSPYYLKEPTNHTFMHFIRSAGTVAIAGEAIYGKHGNGRYLVTKNKEDVRYYRTRAEDLLHRSLPLMHIYRKENEAAFHKQLHRLREKSGNYRIISSAPPLYTISEDLLKRILEHNGVSEPEYGKIISYHTSATKRLRKLCRESDISWVLELPGLDSENHKNNPVRLPVAEIFPDMDIRYTEKEYEEHLSETRQFVETHDGFSLLTDPYSAFRNINITICAGQYVLVSKSNAPTIHFLIYHPKMIEAFEQFVPPIVEMNL
ncbi:MAG: helix-turn-helix domain-containing protein [Eubacterium sp.]|nr:helix-turn-helix domain-containing protein [Eubacterium sp.]